MSVNEITNAQLVPHLAPFVAAAGWDQQFIAELALPPTNTYGQQFTYETYDNAGLVDQGSTKRGQNAGSLILTPAKNSSVTAFLEESSAKIPLDVTIINAAEQQDANRAQAVEGLSSADRQRVGRMRVLVANSYIQKEKDAATLIQTNTNYDASLRTTALSFKTCTITDIKDAMREVQKVYGFMPDTFVMGYKARESFDVNDKFLDRINGGATSTAPAVVTDQLLASLIGVKRILVGTAVSQTVASAGAAGTPTALWTEDFGALIYTGAFEQSDLASPAFGKLFYMNVPATGTRFGTWSWLDSEPNTVEWQKVAEYYLVPSTPIMKAGYHFTNADA